MTLHEFVGGWLYWPFVWIVCSGAVPITLNFITITYTELWQQLKELKRIKDEAE